MPSTRTDLLNSIQTATDGLALAELLTLRPAFTGASQFGVGTGLTAQILGMPC